MWIAWSKTAGECGHKHANRAYAELCAHGLVADAVVKLPRQCFWRGQDRRQPHREDCRVFSGETCSCEAPQNSAP